MFTRAAESPGELAADPGTAVGKNVIAMTDGQVGKLASQVARRIEDDIIRRGWPVGELVGSESELRERYRVSRSVLREAVRLVEHHQVARMRRGPNGGLFVCAPDAGPATLALVIYLEYVGTSIEDLLRARLLLEPLAAALAAERINEDGIRILRDALQEEEARRAEPGVSSQDRLHVVLGELSGNSMLRLFIEVLTRLTTRYAHTSQRTSKADVARAKQDSRDKHAAIVDAVIACEAGQAKILLGGHLEEVAEWLRSHRRRRPLRRPVTAESRNGGTRSGAGEKLAEVIAARIHDDIARDGWRVGEVLGSEAGLLARYQVSRAVLREAVRILEYHEVARMRRGPGGGLFIGSPRPEASIDTMALYLDYLGVTGEDLRIVRDAIELGCIPSVTARRDDQQVVDRLRAAVARTSEFGGAADLFHTELAELAGNPVLTLFLRIITQLWSRHADMPVPVTSAAPEVERIHGLIVDAIVQGDEGLARHRMRRHLEALTAWWH